MSGVERLTSGNTLTAGETPPPGQILTPGRNCWRIEHADRVSFLVDGADYFHAFRETAKNARHSILIVGWDIDSRFKLEREDPGDGLPTRLSDFLNTLVGRNKQLRINVLDWDYSMIYAGGREWLSLYKMDWATHRRLRFRMDGSHPYGASHHQKIAVVDDHVAFVGGLDFSFGRWDTHEHRPHDPRRRDTSGSDPQPYHDVQMMVSGPVAAALGDLVRERWYHATSGRLKAPPLNGEHDPWPEGIDVELADVEVGISRTYPKFNKQDEVHEVEQLSLDAIAAAQDFIFIENQYITSHRIGDALAQRLSTEDCPEIVVIIPQKSFGWLSQNTMDLLRIRVINRLREADRNHRLRVYYPYLDGLDGVCINVHSKVLITDETFLRVGSSNFNNRSMRLDTECDLAIETRDEARIRNAIAGLRNRLLAEHLDVTPEVVADAVAERHSLIGAIEALSGENRTLKHFETRPVTDFDGVALPESVYDPEMPIDSERVARELVSDEDRTPAKRSLLAIGSVLLVALLLAAVWRWTPLNQWINVKEIIQHFISLRGQWIAPVIVTGIYILGSLMVFPITLLIIATGLAFGAAYGFAYALAGSVISALITYALGHWLGHTAIHAMSQRWVARVSHRLAQQGLLAIITLRVIPVAPFTIINLVAGASHIRLRDFLVGTLMGMAPGTLMLTLFSDQVISAIAEPEAMRIASLTLLGLLIILASWRLSRWLTRRQQRDARQGQEQEHQQNPP
jgi:phospholipase D1/2